EITIDSRPSDAIALAIRMDAPIYVDDMVIKKRTAESLDRWLENLRPEDFGKYNA
ncbi:MAG: bifunctional nuclease family protein, partial [Nitrospinae bacterium]|nr:bifunctional nuclease family protein [Nitrospinota bacterium]